MKTMNWKLMAGLSVIGLSASSFAAMAQDAAATGGIEDIVVTAQKKSENLQSVPISVSAIGGDKIANMNLTSLQGLQGSVPNVQIDNFANTPQSAVFNIRGIGVIEPDPYAGNTVGIVVDGVPQFFSMGALLDTYDVDRVEILRGPQGTLFGANTTGGVVNVVTKRPSGEFGGYVKGTYGNWNRFDLSAAFDAPIVQDKLALRVAGIHSQRDGWVTNTFNGKSMGDKNLDAVRATLVYTPDSDLKITLQGEHVATRNGAPVVVNGGRPYGGYLNGPEANYVPAGTYWNGSVLPMYESPCAGTGTCKAPKKYFSGNNEVPDTSDMNTYFGIGTIEYSNSPIGDITSITGYKNFTLFEYTDQDGTAKTNNATRRQTKAWSLSQELRTAFDVNDSINAVVGGFYMKNHYEHYQMYHLDFALPGLAQLNLQDQDNESLSAFAQTYVDLTDRLKLQAGVRYTHEKTDAVATLDSALSVPALTSPNWAVDSVLGDLRKGPHQVNAGGSKSWDQVGWKIGLDYELGQNQLVYASWARGFKSGGFTGRISNATDGSTPFDPETVDTFEVGLKADFLDRRLRTNFAAFMTNYRDMQVAQIGYDSVRREQYNRILNAGKAEIKGFEAEITAVPTEGLTLRGSLAYLDAKYKTFDYVENGTSYNLKGYDLQDAPKWSSTLGINYSYALPNDARIVADASWSYTAKKFYTAIRDTPRSTVQATYLIDALLTYHAPDDKYTVGLWGKNLLDKRYIATVYDSPGYMGLTGYAPPRQYGVSVGVNF
ncbi:TonB-dependent receptor [Aquisediminimonas sediminicola]|uniref:TonB-dependent receptor n=1 Tax=Alteraquisediminimonas sediminicola TaxID=2676787 RepID=UPI001FE86EFD|nr:TonB-dependent receptor [Aquisediminimonas sediminicola]